MSVIIAPLLASVTITNSTTYSPAPDLLECNINLSADGRASTFDVRLDNRSGDYTAITAGDAVSVSVGKSSASMSSLFAGIIERRRGERPSRNENYLLCSGTDYSHKLLNTIVPGIRGDTGRYTFEPGDINHSSGWYIEQIVRDLLDKYNLPPTSIDITYTSSGVGVSGTIVNSSSLIPNIEFNYKPLNDCIKELADLAPLYNFYVDGNRQLQFFYEQNKDSGLTIDNTLIKELYSEIDIQSTKNIIYILGGDQSGRDINYTGTSQTITTYSAYQAVMFTPTQPILKEIWLHVSVVGNPPADLDGEVRMGSGLGSTSEAPTGAVLSVFRISKDKIPTVADWRIASINYEPLQIVPHWIVLWKSNGDVNNTYRWSHGGETVGENASSSNGLPPWVVRTSSYRPATRTYYTTKIIHKDMDEESVIHYGPLEMAISKPEINDREQALVLAGKYKFQYGKARNEITASIYPPDILPTPGQLVTISDSVSGISGLFIVTQMNYNIRGYETHNIDMKAFRFE